MTGCNSVIFEWILMKFCLQKFFWPPGKNTKFQQGHKGCKAKGHKAIKAGAQKFQNNFLSILGICKWIAPIFEGWSTHYHWSYVNCQLCITFFFILCSINLNTCEYVPCEYASHRQSLYLLKTFVQLSIVLTKRAEMHCTDCLQRI